MRPRESEIGLPRWVLPVPFISFEGIDGSGKTTQLRLLAQWLERRGHPVVRTKEPDGGRLGGDVRALMTKERTFHLDPIEELMLIATARYDHVRSVIRPALAAGSWVLCDRFVDSTFALQVHGTTVPAELYDAVNRAVVGETLPDATIILDLTPGDAVVRRTGRSVADPAEAVRDFERIRAGFRARAGTEPVRCKLIDARPSEAEVAAAVRHELQDTGLLPG